MPRFECPELTCTSKQLMCYATHEHGWLLKCSNGHELFPHPETIIRAEQKVWIRFKS